LKITGFEDLKGETKETTKVEGFNNVPLGLFFGFPNIRFACRVQIKRIVNRLKESSTEGAEG